MLAGGLMRNAIRFVIALLLAICTLRTIAAQITANPIPDPITKRGLQVEIKDVVRLPDTRGIRPPDQDVTPAGWARIQFVRDLPDGRRFVNDERGFLYLIDANNKPQVYANLGELSPVSVCGRLESGFIGFSVHPECARNGFSTPCVPNAVRAIPRQLTSSRQVSRRRM